MPKAPPNAKKAALVIVNAQNDFVEGSVRVEGAEDVLKKINAVKNGVLWKVVILCQDSHPKEHISFIDMHPNNRTAQKTGKIKIGGRVQRLWERHCVKDSKGEKFHPSLSRTASDIVIKKGEEKDIDFDSAFYDTTGETSTDLSAVLSKRRVTDVYVCGMAYDNAVGLTAIDAVKEGYKTFIVRNATCARNPFAKRDMTQKLQNAGVGLIHSTVLLEKREDDNRQKAAEYFESKRIMPLLQRLTALLIHHKPKNPREFLVKELTRLKETQTPMSEITPALLTDKDLEVVFRSSDFPNRGLLNEKQCRQALVSIGIPKSEINLLSGTTYNVSQFKEKAMAGFLTM